MPLRLSEQVCGGARADAVEALTQNLHTAGICAARRHLRLSGQTFLRGTHRERMRRGKAAQLAEQLQAVYLRDKKASETIRAGVLEALGLLVEAAPWVCFHHRMQRKFHTSHSWHRTREMIRQECCG